MHPLLMEILPQIRQGYCCSQLLVHVLLQSQGQCQDMRPDMLPLMRAMHGLCFGMGGSEGPCGLLTGGAALLGAVAGRGGPEENPHPSLAPLVHDYQQWFAGRVQDFGGIFCHSIVQGLSREVGVHPPPAGESPPPQVCGILLAECFEKILDLLEAYDIAPELG